MLVWSAIVLALMLAIFAWEVRAWTTPKPPGCVRSVLDVGRGACP
jgi:hypothetical protein